MTSLAPSPTQSATAPRRVRPLVFDLTGHYEPSADFVITPSVRVRLKALERRYHRSTWFVGRHSGRPTLQTDIRGISVGTRLDISRLAFTHAGQVATLCEAFELFQAVARDKLTSGPLQSIALALEKRWRRPDRRQVVHEAFRATFGHEAVFLTLFDKLRIGRCVPHQTLLEHLRENGPYHSDHVPRVEALREELRREPGQYEGHRFLVRPQVQPAGRPLLEFCYSGERPDARVEASVKVRLGEALRFVPTDQVRHHADQFATLHNYEHASRRFGQLWVLQGDMVRALERPCVGTLLLLLGQPIEPDTERWFKWDELFARQRVAPHVNRSLQASPTYLDTSLRTLVENNFLEQKKDRYRLNVDFERFQHVTFYELGDFDKRLA